MLFHHDPDSTDRMVDSILRQAREEFDSVFAASEGMVITLGAPGESVEAHMPGTRTALRREAQFRAKVCGVTEGGKAFRGRNGGERYVAARSADFAASTCRGCNRNCR